MAETLIERFTSSFDHDKYEDEYRARLLDVVKRKREETTCTHRREPERDAPSDLSRLSARAWSRERRDERAQEEADAYASARQEQALVHSLPLVPQFVRSHPLRRVARVR